MIDDRLIVALDNPDILSLADVLRDNLGINFFKLGISALFEDGGWNRARILAQEGSLFLDLKFYDTRDTVERTIRRAFDFGARFVTVHATPSVMEAAMRAKPSDVTKVLAVSHLSDNPGNFSSSELRYALSICDGAICSGPMIACARQWISKEGIIVSPGIRPARIGTDNHVAPSTPAEALRCGADYLVVGRPITMALNPVAAAKAILAKMMEGEPVPRRGGEHDAHPRLGDSQ